MSGKKQLTQESREIVMKVYDYFSQEKNHLIKAMLQFGKIVSHMLKTKSQKHLNKIF